MYTQTKHAQKYNKYFGFQDNREKIEREDSTGLKIVALIGGRLI